MFAPLPYPRFAGVHFNSLPNNRCALLSERLEQATQGRSKPTASRTLHFPTALLIGKVLALLGSLFTDPLFSLQSPSNARDKKKTKNRGRYIDRQRKGLDRAGGRSSFFFFLALAERKIKQ